MRTIPNSDSHISDNMWNMIETVSIIKNGKVKMFDITEQQQFRANIQFEIGESNWTIVTE